MFGFGCCEYDYGGVGVECVDYVVGFDDEYCWWYGDGECECFCVCVVDD